MLFIIRNWVIINNVQL